MASVVLRPSAFVEFDQDPGILAGGTSAVFDFRDYVLDGTDLPADAVIDGSVSVFVSGQHQFLVVPDSAPSKSNQRRWVTAGGDADSDNESGVWPLPASAPSDTFAAPSAGLCTGLSSSFATHPSGAAWTRANLLAAEWGFDLGWYNATPNPHPGRISHVCDFYVTVEYHLSDEPEPPPPETIPPTPSIPCCSSCCEHDPSGPTSEGPTLPPDTFEHFPQCVGGGEMPVYEALVDSELYY